MIASYLLLVILFSYFWTVFKSSKTYQIQLVRPAQSSRRKPIEIGECIKNKRKYSSLLAEIAACAEVGSMDVEILARIYVQILHDQIEIGKRLTQATVKTIRTDLQLDHSRLAVYKKPMS